MRGLLCIYGFLLLFLSACSSRLSEEVIQETNVVSPPMISTNVTDVLVLDKVSVCDSFLVAIGRMEYPCFHVYNRNTFKKIGSFGMEGSGPGDFLFPFFLEDMNAPSKCLQVYDVNLASFKYINIMKALEGTPEAVETFPMPSDLIGSPDLNCVGDFYFGNMDAGTGLFFSYSTAEDRFKWIDFPSGLLAPEKQFTVMNMNRIAVNGKESKIVSGMFYYNKVFLYDTEGRLLRRVQLGENNVSPILIDGESIDSNSQLCCTDIRGTDEYVYLLEQEVTEKDSFSPSEDMHSRIVVLDWNLNYIKTYSLSCYAHSFCIDEKLNRVLCVTRTPNGDTELVYFKE